MSQTRLRQEHRQQQTLTPRLQQAVRLLQLSSLDFALEVNRALETNPFLENDEAADGDAGHRPPQTDVARENLAATRENLADAPQVTVIDAAPDPRADGEWESSAWAQYGSPGSKRANGSESDVDFAELASVDESLRDHLKTQAQLLPVSERDQVLMATVIEALDDDGYLRIDLEELKAWPAQIPSRRSTNFSWRCAWSSRSNRSALPRAISRVPVTAVARVPERQSYDGPRSRHTHCR